MGGTSLIQDYRIKGIISGVDVSYTRLRTLSLSLWKHAYIRATNENVLLSFHFLKQEANIWTTERYDLGTLLL
jgi:hypothetical protein